MSRTEVNLTPEALDRLMRVSNAMIDRYSRTGEVPDFIEASEEALAFERLLTKHPHPVSYQRHEDDDTGRVTLKGYGGRIEFSYQATPYEPKLHPFYSVEIEGRRQYYELDMTCPVEPYEGDSDDPVSNEKLMANLFGADVCRNSDIDYCIVDLHTEGLVQRNIVSFVPLDES